MKKIIALLLTVICLLLVGCSRTPALEYGVTEVSGVEPAEEQLIKYVKASLKETFGNDWLYTTKYGSANIDKEDFEYSIGCTMVPEGKDSKDFELIYAHLLFAEDYSSYKLVDLRFADGKKIDLENPVDENGNYNTIGGSWDD